MHRTVITRLGRFGTSRLPAMAPRTRACPLPSGRCRCRFEDRAVVPWAWARRYMRERLRPARPAHQARQIGQICAADTGSGKNGEVAQNGDTCALLQVSASY